ncbi:Atu4866 domain-containing protein [Lentzea sp. HUAS12]|uniref:Atu4866 domain-containing protein n=1 Tax=Lentzea sp. HUAS12 TaxID=2951806 RepID=UPI003531D37E
MLRGPMEYVCYLISHRKDHAESFASVRPPDPAPCSSRGQRGFTATGDVRDGILYHEHLVLHREQ